MDGGEGLSEKEKGVLASLIGAYMTRYGESWTDNLHRTLRPTPVATIAAEHSVSVAMVRKMKQHLWMVGMIKQAVNTQLAAEAAEAGEGDGEGIGPTEIL